MKHAVLFTAALLMVLPMTAAAGDDDEYYPLKIGSISFRLGYFWPSAESDLWTENFDLLTSKKEDFNGLQGGMEFTWFASRNFALGVSFDYYKRTVTSNYIDYVDNFGNELYQDITLEVVPITATAKFMPLGNGAPGYRGGRGSPFVPWVGAGAGVYAFRYEEFGEFIDFGDMSIIEGSFLTEDAAFGVHVAGGVIIPIGFDWDVFGEFRYAWAEGDLSEDFLGFEPLDLGGMSVTFGFSYRF